MARPNGSIIAAISALQGICASVGAFRAIHTVQTDLAGIDDNFAGMLEHHGDAIADGRLHQAQAPFRFLRVAHVNAGFKLTSYHLPPNHNFSDLESYGVAPAQWQPPAAPAAVQWPAP